MADNTNILPNDQNFVRAAGFESSTSPGIVLAGKIIEASGRIKVDNAGGGSGSVTSVSVVSANGFAGTVATPTTTPAITLSTTVTGLLIGNGTAISAVTIGTGLQLVGSTLSSTVTGTVTSVSGTTNRITSTGGTTPVIDISASYIGQSSITTLGTVTTGTLSTGAVIAGVTMTLGSDATGDIYYRNSSGVLTRLAIGSNSNVLSITAGLPAWIAAPAASLTVGTTTIASGTTTRILYDNSGTLGEYTITGTGTVVAMQTSPTLVTPVLGVASATSLNKITITTPATGATLTLIDGKTLTINKTISFTAADDTGVYTLPTGTKTLLATDGAGTSLTGIPYTLTGTANQVVLSAGTGNITFSLPQSIATSSNPQFATIELGAASDTTISRVSAGVIAVEGVNVLLNGGALGTPSSGTLTNATGLPIAGLVASTSTAIGVGSIELGAASDTTIARVSAGVISIEGVTIPSISSTNTLSNKRMTRRTATTNNPGATPTTNSDNVDVQIFTGMANAVTSFTTNLSGTPVSGDFLEFWLTDNGTARALTWGASFAATTVALPTTTVISTKLRVLFEWGGSTWDVVAVA